MTGPLAATVLDDAMSDGRLTQNTPITFLWMFGETHPALAYAYVRQHLHTLLGAVPPTQQAWLIGALLAGQLWPAAPPSDLEAFLHHAFPSDTATVREASARIEQRWRERRALVRALRAFSATATKR